MVTPCGDPLNGVSSVERAWYDAYGQSVGGSVVMAEGDVVGTGGNSGGKSAVWDAL